MIGIFGKESDFLPSHLATNRSILQKFIIVKETMVDDQNVHFSKISLVDIANVVSSDLLKQWETVSSGRRQTMSPGTGQARGSERYFSLSWINYSTYLLVSTRFSSANNSQV